MLVVAALMMAVIASGAVAAPGSQQHELAAMDDAHFAGMMAKHHQGGIEMARLEERAGSSKAVKALAAKIRAGQQSELPKLQAHAKGHKPDAKFAEHEKQMLKEHAAAMSRLKAAKGPVLDKLFADQMIAHHEQGLKAIEATTFQDPELKALADKMAANHKQEIEELRKTLRLGS